MQLEQNQPWAQRPLISGILIAIVYLMIGKLGLMLALPPDFASPVFPAVGIAVAAVFVLWIQDVTWNFSGVIAVKSMGGL